MYKYLIEGYGMKTIISALFLCILLTNSYAQENPSEMMKLNQQKADVLKVVEPFVFQ